MKCIKRSYVPSPPSDGILDAALFDMPSKFDVVFINFVARSEYENNIIKVKIPIFR